MILEPGHWVGRGSYRAIDQTIGVQFEATIEVQENEHGLTAEIRAETNGKTTFDGIFLIVPDEYGTYSLTLRYDSFNLEGTAKLESVPHLAILWSDEADTYVTFSVFTLPESHGVRGFVRHKGDLSTWELALQPRHQVVTGENIVSFDRRRRFNR